MNEDSMRKYLSVMSALVCLMWITGCSSVEKKEDNDSKVKCADDKSKQEKAAAADLAKRKEQAEKLMPVLKIGETVTRFSEQMKKLQVDMLARQLKARPPQNAEEINKAVNELINKEVNWDKLKDQFVNLYAEAFTVEELDALIKFYESPIGRKLVDKQPDIQQKSMLATRKLLADTTQKVHKLTMELVEKQQKAAAAKAAAEAPVKDPTAQTSPPLPVPAAPGAKNVIPLK